MNSTSKLGAVLHSSNEPSELSQWPWGHDDSTINIVMGIIIIIIKQIAFAYVQLHGPSAGVSDGWCYVCVSLTDDCSDSGYVADGVSVSSLPAVNHSPVCYPASVTRGGHNTHSHSATYLQQVRQRVWSLTVTLNTAAASQVYN